MNHQYLFLNLQQIQKYTQVHTQVHTKDSEDTSPQESTPQAEQAGIIFESRKFIQDTQDTQDSTGFLYDLEKIQYSPGTEFVVLLGVHFRLSSSTSATSENAYGSCCSKCYFDIRDSCPRVQKKNALFSPCITGNRHYQLISKECAECMKCTECTECTECTGSSGCVL